MQVTLNLSILNLPQNSESNSFPGTSLLSFPSLPSNCQLAGNKFCLLQVTPRLFYYQRLFLLNSSIRSIQNILKR